MTPESLWSPAIDPQMGAHCSPIEDHWKKPGLGSKAVLGPILNIIEVGACHKLRTLNVYMLINISLVD